ncbi:putative antirestriction protein [Escherichia coli]|nr:putative antirestriction protein [Escherichia coli]
MQYAKPVTLNVEECDRLSFLPYLFGQDFLYAEASVYALAKQMMPEYEGGFWHFIRLPDGGGYMMPDGDRFHMVNGANWFDRTVSADAAGVILTSLVINRQLWLYHDSGDAGLAGLVMTVLTVGLVSCAGKSLPRFWPGDFFPTFYACHLAVLGVLAL